MPRDEQLIKAALDMAAETAGAQMAPITGTPYAAGGRVFAAAIRALTPAEVLAKVGGGRSEENRQNDQQLLGGTVVLCREEITPDAVARLVNALESGKSFAESWIEENGGIDGCDYQDRVSYENICAVLAACKGVRNE